MGKANRIKGKFSRNSEKKAPKDAWRNSTEQTPVVLENQNFETYYKSQGIISEAEWEAFMTSLKTPLPTSFRITGTRKQALEILDTIEKRYVPSLSNLDIEGEAIDPPTPLPWYPNNFGWQITSSRSVIKKSKEFTKFHRFLVAESEVGNISRQEAVSMVPPLMLDVKPHHWVLDMCAAPGSKTAQLIEALHAEDELKEDSKLRIPSGLVMANDTDEKRCYTLVHQIKRLRSPNFIVTNHEAQNFPTLRVDQEDVGDEYKQIRFDRVLCDVPCSGDGTLRKNLLIWKDWHVGQGLSLHVLQASILARGVQLLKVGGKLVYSTCSLNPLENEAVVASALNRFSGKIRLIDTSQMLPDLKRCPGLSSWKVFIKKDVEVNSYEDLDPTDKKKKWAAFTLFPPENASELGLEKCVRIYPHLQNTGGFFVAVFEKIEATSSNECKHPNDASIPLNIHEKEALITEEELEAKSSDTGVENKEEVSLEVNDEFPTETNLLSKRPPTERLERRNNKRAYLGKDEPYVFMGANSPELENLKKHFNLEGFPTNQFLVRSETDKNKTVSFSSKSICKILASKDIHRLKVINTGVKAFQRCDNSGKKECSFRLQNESLSIILPFLPPTIVVQVTPADMKVLLTQQTPFINTLTPAVQEKLTPLEPGAVVITFDPSCFGSKADEGSTEQPELLISPEAASQMVYPLWKANVSVNLLLAKQEQSSLLHRLFGFEEK